MHPAMNFACWCSSNSCFDFLGVGLVSLLTISLLPYTTGVSFDLNKKEKYTLCLLKLSRHRALRLNRFSFQHVLCC